MAVCQNLVPLVNIKIAGKWMFIPIKIVLIGIDPYPYFLITRSEWLPKVRANTPSLFVVEPGHRVSYMCVGSYRSDHIIIYNDYIELP